LVQSDEAYVEVVAKNGNVQTRTDLANNKYLKGPRVVLFNSIGAKAGRRSPRISARRSTTSGPLGCVDAGRRVR